MRVPGDKSISHRAVILNGLARGTARVTGFARGADTLASVAAMQAFGVTYAFESAETLLIRSPGRDALRPPTDPIDCGNSGTTMRLLAGLAAGLEGRSELDGDASLRQRPMDRVLQPLAAMGALYLIVNKTKMGTAMRAVSEDRDAAAMMGIDVNKIIVFTFVLGGCMAGIGGVLFCMVYNQIYYFTGFLPGIKAFSAAVLGGIGNVPGAMLGGFFLGVVESVGPALFLDGVGIRAPYQLRDLIAFTMLVMVLIFRPQGILGERLAAQRA